NARRDHSLAHKPIGTIHETIRRLFGPLMCGLLLMCVLLVGCGDTRDVDITTGNPPELPPAAALPVVMGPGAWSATEIWPNVAIHLAVLPDGNVLSWGNDVPADHSSITTADSWNPLTGA